jgi:hypothetical protein
MSGNDRGKEEPPTDFNDYVSKNELRAVLDDKLNEILQQITNLARRVEDVERCPEPHIVMMRMMKISKRRILRMLVTLRLKPKHDVRRMYAVSAFSVISAWERV